jgi:hypothetical protein
MCDAIVYKASEEPIRLKPNQLLILQNFESEKRTSHKHFYSDKTAEPWIVFKKYQIGQLASLKILFQTI